LRTLAKQSIATPGGHTREGGVSSTPRPFGSIANAGGILDHPLSRDDSFGFNFSNSHIVYRHSFAFSPRDAPEFAKKFPSTLIQRAQGMPGARCARSLACKLK
jgi:hypothetical protein